MYGYANIGGILMGSMLPYIAAPWILWVYIYIYIHIHSYIRFDYPLVNQQFAIENGPVEIVDLPSYKIVIFHSYVKLPEGISTLCMVNPLSCPGLVAHPRQWSEVLNAAGRESGSVCTEGYPQISW